MASAGNSTTFNMSHHTSNWYSDPHN